MTRRESPTEGRDSHRAIVPLRRRGRAESIGVYKPKRTVDARSLARAGEPVFELRAVYDDVVEVRFADGEWLLCDCDEVRPAK